MLFKLSIRNIRRSLKDYVIYFFTLVLGVAIFYIFNSLESQTVMLNVSQNTHDLIALVNGVMSVLSVFVAVVLGFLILYASRFLMRRRKKEFGIYMTLGMGKGQISRILLIETLLIGIAALGVGLALGVVLSQFISVFVANMFEADMTSFYFVFSGKALLSTIGLFSLIYLVVMVFNTISVGRQRLINLIHSDKMNEKVKVRNTAVCLVMFAAAVALLARAYYGVTNNLAELTETNLVLYIVMGIVGTFLLFWSWSGLALKIAMRVKGLYYRGMNMFVFREVNSKINTTVISMSIISLLLFLTIGIFSSAMSIKNSMTSSLHELVPADFQAMKQVGVLDFGSGDAGGEESKRDHMTTLEALRSAGIDVDEYFREYHEIAVYVPEGLTYRDTIGEEIMRSIDGMSSDVMERLMESRDRVVKVDDYNAIADFYGRDRVELSDDEYVVVANYDVTVDARNKSLREYGLKVEVGGRELKPKYDEVVDGFLEMSANRINPGFLVVPNNLDLAGEMSGSFFVGNYAATDKAGVAEKEEALRAALIDVDIMSDYYVSVSTKMGIYENSIGLSALVTFVGLYLGSIFLITSAALLGLKEISESSDNRQKYMTLRDLGVDQKSLNRTLLVQIGLFFGLPLLVAIVHSIFGIMFANQVILTFARVDLLWSIVLTAAFIIAIYGGYFLITYFTAKRITMARD